MLGHGEHTVDAAFEKALLPGARGWSPFNLIRVRHYWRSVLGIVIVDRHWESSWGRPCRLTNPRLGWSRVRLDDPERFQCRVCPLDSRIYQSAVCSQEIRLERSQA